MAQNCNICMFENHIMQVENLIFEGKNVQCVAGFFKCFGGENQAGQRGEVAAQSQPVLEERIICRAKSPGGGLL